MNKAGWLKRVNIILFLCALSQVVTGFSHVVISDEVFEIIHPVVGILFAIFAVFHVVLNWAWIKANVLK